VFEETNIFSTEGTARLLSLRAEADVGTQFRRQELSKRQCDATDCSESRLFEDSKVLQ